MLCKVKERVKDKKAGGVVKEKVKVVKVAEEEEVVQVANVFVLLVVILPLMKEGFPVMRWFALNVVLVW